MLLSFDIKALQRRLVAKFRTLWSL